MRRPDDGRVYNLRIKMTLPQIGAAITSPIALAGFAIAVFSIILRQVLAKRMASLGKTHAYRLLSQIAFYGFIIALVTVVLGMWIYMRGATENVDPKASALESEIRHHLDNAFYTDAAKEADQLIQLRPDYAVAYKLKGHALFKQGEHNAALAQFDRALELDPSFTAARFDKAATLMTMKRYDEARVIFEDLSARDATDIDARYNLVSLKLLTGDYKGAAEGYAQLYELRKGVDRSQAALGRGVSELMWLYMSPTRDEAAIDGAVGHLRHALDLNPYLRGVFLGILDQDQRHQYDGFISLLKQIEMLEQEQTVNKYRAFVANLRAS